MILLHIVQSSESVINAPHHIKQMPSYVILYPSGSELSDKIYFVQIKKTANRATNEKVSLFNEKFYPSGHLMDDGRIYV